MLTLDERLQRLEEHLGFEVPKGSSRLDLYKLMDRIKETSADKPGYDLVKIIINNTKYENPNTNMSQFYGVPISFQELGEDKEYALVYSQTEVVYGKL